MEFKRCVRCGKFYATDVEVCHECEKKDVADLSKLKNFFNEGYTTGLTREDISASTGITAKNLNRFLSLQEFEGIYIPEQEEVELNKLNNEDDDIVTKL